MSLAADRPPQEAEAAFLESLRREYEEKGYTFVVHPSRADLPAFFATYQPDAIARGPNHNVVIEVKSRATPAAQQSLQRIRQLFEGREDWQFRVAYLGSNSDNVRQLPVPSRDSVLEQAKQAERLVTDGNLRAAYVLAWSLLEAALNSARPDSDKRPRTPASVVQTLAIDGLITIELEQALRSLVELRNRVVHGDLSAEPQSKDVSVVLSAVRSILG